jgi:hypothetical protein
MVLAATGVEVLAATVVEVLAATVVEQKLEVEH